MSRSPALPARSGPAQGPDEILILSYLASRFLRYGPVEKARVLYGLLCTLKPRDLRYRVGLGFACLKGGSAGGGGGRTEEALAHLEAAFKGRRDSLGLEGWEVMLLERALRANGLGEQGRSLVEAYLRREERP